MLRPYLLGLVGKFFVSRETVARKICGTRNFPMFHVKQFWVCPKLFWLERVVVLCFWCAQAGGVFFDFSSRYALSVRYGAAKGGILAKSSRGVSVF